MDGLQQCPRTRILESLPYAELQPLRALILNDDVRNRLDFARESSMRRVVVDLSGLWPIRGTAQGSGGHRCPKSEVPLNSGKLPHFRDSRIFAFHAAQEFTWNVTSSPC